MDACPSTAQGLEYVFGREHHILYFSVLFESLEIERILNSWFFNTAGKLIKNQFFNISSTYNTCRIASRTTNYCVCHVLPELLCLLVNTIRSTIIFRQNWVVKNPLWIAIKDFEYFYESLLPRKDIASLHLQGWGIRFRPKTITAYNSIFCLELITFVRNVQHR